MERVQRFEGFLYRAACHQEEDKEEWSLICPGTGNSSQNWKLSWDGQPDQAYPMGAHTTYRAFEDKPVVIWGSGKDGTIRHARIYPKNCPNPGLYVGQDALHAPHFRRRLSCELRVDFEMNWLSVDFFEDGSWLVSIRGPMEYRRGAYRIRRPTMVTNHDYENKESRRDGELSIKPAHCQSQQGNQRLFVTAHLGLCHAFPFEGWVDLQLSSQKNHSIYRQCEFKLRWFSQADVPFLEFETGNPAVGQTSFEALVRRLGIEPEVDLRRGNTQLQYPENGASIEWDTARLNDFFREETGGIDPLAGWQVHILVLPGKPVGDIQGFTGVMFDNAPDDRFPRQACAVFIDRILEANQLEKADVNHPVFIRELVYWMIHEVGHIFNLSDKVISTFMNRRLVDRKKFWQSFNYDLVVGEHKHLRHGFYPEVVPGGFKRLGERFRPGASLEHEALSMSKVVTSASQSLFSELRN